MPTQSQKRRIKKALTVAETLDQFAVECLCFPKEEQPRFPFPIMQDIAAAVKCPLHGERFTQQGSIYTSVWRRQRVQAEIGLHSEQYQLAWAASFPSTLWPAEEPQIGGKTHLRLGDGTVLSTDGGLQEAVGARSKTGVIEYVGNPLQNRFRWNPATRAQRQALDCPADILLLGGAAGSLKTTTLLADLIQEYDNSRMNSYFYRKSYPELEDVIPRAHEIFAQMGATFNSTERLFRFPSGAKVRFRCIQGPKDLYRAATLLPCRRAD